MYARLSRWSLLLDAAGMMSAAAVPAAGAAAAVAARGAATAVLAGIKPPPLAAAGPTGGAITIFRESGGRGPQDGCPFGTVPVQPVRSPPQVQAGRPWPSAPAPPAP